MQWLHLHADAFDAEPLGRAGEPFVALLAADSRAASVDGLSAAIERLLSAGARALCCWGPGCERLHDIADEVIVGDGRGEASPDGERSSTGLDGDGSPTRNAGEVLTTWHAGQPISAALEVAGELARGTGVSVIRCYDVGGVRTPEERQAMRVWISDRAIADTAALLPTLPGRVLCAVHSIGFTNADPVNTDDASLGSGDHLAEQAVELVFDDGRTVHLTWDNAISSRGFGDYAIEIRAGAMPHPVAPGAAVPWSTRAWERSDPAVDDHGFTRWDVSGHPFWEAAIGDAITRVRARMNDDGIGDILIELGGAPVLFSASGDRVRVSPTDRAAPESRQGPPRRTLEWTR